MSLNFPPTPSHEQEIEVVLGELVRGICDRMVLYLSAPMTTGKGLLDLKTGSDKDPRASADVLRDNVAEIHALASRLRPTLSKPLIEPTQVPDQLGWTQDDYRCLWGRFIERHAGGVIFRDGWEYSNGCAFEFLAAHKNGVDTFTESLNSLSLEDGISLLRRAIAHMQAHHAPTRFLELVLGELIRLQMHRSNQNLDGRIQ